MSLSLSQPRTPTSVPKYGFLNQPQSAPGGRSYSLNGSLIGSLGSGTSGKGSFINYVDNIFSLFNHLLTPDWRLWRNLLWYIHENLHIFDISSATYLPCLVNVVCKRPLSEYEWQSHSKSLQRVAWKINQSIFSGVREVDDTVRELRKENFNLKLRIYFLEERLGKFLMIIAVWAG